MRGATLSCVTLQCVATARRDNCTELSLQRVSGQEPNNSARQETMVSCASNFFTVPKFHAETPHQRSALKRYDKMYFILNLYHVSFACPQSGDVIQMPVPSSFNDVTEERWLRDFVGWVWYEREVYVPWVWSDPQIRVVLRFESVHYYCKVVR